MSEVHDPSKHLTFYLACGTVVSTAITYDELKATVQRIPAEIGQFLEVRPGVYIQMAHVVAILAPGKVL